MHPHRPRPSPLLELGIVAVLASMLLAACGSAVPTATPLPAIPTLAATTAPIASTPPTMVPVESDEPEPTDADTGSPGTPACATNELKASRGIGESDADDRLTEVVLVAAGTCSIDAWPALLLQDADDHVLVAASAGGAGGLDLVGGVAYTSTVRLSNWCVDAAFPVSIGIVQGIETIVVTGDSFPDEGDLPPCAHDDASPVLSGTAWAPKP